LTVDALGDLHGFNLHGGNTHRLMHRNRAANANRNAAFVSGLESKHLSKASDIQPRSAGKRRVFILALNALGCRCGSLAQAAETIVTAVIRLYKDCLAHILHPVADLAFDAHIRNLAKAVVVRAGTVAVEGIAIAVRSG